VDTSPSTPPTPLTPPASRILGNPLTFASMSEPANRTGPWQRYLSNGPPPSQSTRLLNTDPPNAVDMSSQSSADASQSTIDLDNPDDAGLNWKPQGIGGRARKDRFWKVENSKRCSDFCKDQLKVIHLIFIANVRTFQRDFCGPLKPGNPRQHGLNSMKLFIVNTSLPMSFANGAEGTFNIQTPLTTKAHHQ